MCVSSKLYSSLAAGRPILAVVGEGDEVARTVREHDCGAYVRPGDAEAAAETLAGWADDSAYSEELGEHARAAFEAHYTRCHAVRAYRNLFEQMHGRSSHLFQSTKSW
jgi:glycosyltransferase involved in cell wall biosynthesis